MSEIPPLPDPGQVPPEGYAAYPRGIPSAEYGSADKLQALADGYFGLNYVFIVNVLLALASRFAGVSVETPQAALAYFAIFATVTFLAVAGLSFPCNKKIAFGKDWPIGNAILASVLMGLNSVLCCGIIGYIVMQVIASNEMKKYGLAAGAFGVRKKWVAERIRQIREVEAAKQSNNPPI